MTDANLVAAADHWATELKGNVPLHEYDASTLRCLLRELAQAMKKAEVFTAKHDEAVIATHIIALHDAVRENLLQQLEDAELRGYQRQLSERMGASMDHINARLRLADTTLAAIASSGGAKDSTIRQMLSMHDTAKARLMADAARNR